MSHLVAENILKIQKFLHTKGFLHSTPTEEWTAGAISGYSTYLESIGVPFPQNREVPFYAGQLSPELRSFVFAGSSYYENESENDDEDNLLEGDLAVEDESGLDLGDNTNQLEYNSESPEETEDGEDGEFVLDLSVENSSDETKSENEDN